MSPCLNNQDVTPYVQDILLFQKNGLTKTDLVILKIILYPLQLVCVEVLRPSQPNGVMSSAVSLPNHTFTGQA